MGDDHRPTEHIAAKYPRHQLGVDKKGAISSEDGDETECAQPATMEHTAKSGSVSKMKSRCVILHTSPRPNQHW